MSLTWFSPLLVSLRSFSFCYCYVTCTLHRLLGAFKTTHQTKYITMNQLYTLIFGTAYPTLDATNGLVKVPFALERVESSTLAFSL